MTTLLARPPLHELPMSKAQAQSGSRRQSARLRQREDSLPPATSANATESTHDAKYQNVKETTIAPVAKAKTSAANPKKRKTRVDDEDDDGFKFSRAKKKKAESPQPQLAQSQLQQKAASSAATATEPKASRSQPKSDKQPLPSKAADLAIEPQQNGQNQPPSRQKKRRMSFSTPTKKESQSSRRSKRLSADVRDDQNHDASEPAQTIKPPKLREQKPAKQKPPAPTASETADSQSLPSPPSSKTQHQSPSPESQPQDADNSGTKIALPFADTPVQSRNKAMRQGKSTKGERRSSLGLRGRRASSLIDQGNSSALPHPEVDPKDFYKHIESELLEPRRMRQLLTWCLARAMHPKSQGMNFEESSARSAARVIEEELSKDLATNNDLSNWFGRDDQPQGPISLPERPNPKNVTNLGKIAELEERLESLRAEKNSLLALTKPTVALKPVTYAPVKPNETGPGSIDNSEISLLVPMRSAASLPTELSSRVNTVSTTLGPAIDTLADGLHKLNQSRRNTDQVASQVLALCAEKLAQRQQTERNKTLGDTDEGSAARNLNSVLRGLSRTAQ